MSQSGPCKLATWCLPKPGQIRPRSPKFCRLRDEPGPTWDRKRSDSTHLGPNAGKLATKSTSTCRCGPRFDRRCAEFGRFPLGSARDRPNLSRLRSNSVRYCPEEETPGLLPPHVGQSQPEVHQTWPGIGKSSVNIGPSLAKLGPSSTKFDTTLANFGLHCPEVNQIWSEVDHIWPNFGQIWTNLVTSHRGFKLIGPSLGRSPSYRDPMPSKRELGPSSYRRSSATTGPTNHPARLRSDLFPNHEAAHSATHRSSLRLHSAPSVWPRSGAFVAVAIAHICAASCEANTAQATSSTAKHRQSRTPSTCRSL